MDLPVNSLDGNDASGVESLGHQDEVVIAVLGSTGSGKSSFIKLVTGDASIGIGDSLESETLDVKTFPFHDPTSGRKVIIVDTPGFDDSRAGVTDTDVLKKIANFLVGEYDKDRKLNGLIYFQRISDPRFGGQAGSNLRMFKKLCGEEPFKNVVVVTTFWDRVASEQEGSKREEELKSKFFRDLVGGGARFMRHDRTAESAQKVLGHIFTLVPTNVQIQEEIRVQGKSLEDTAAGSMRREEVEEIMARHKQEVADLKAEMATIRRNDEEARRELEAERDKLQQELARWQSEISVLKKGLDDEKNWREQLQAEIGRLGPPPYGENVLADERKKREEAEKRAEAADRAKEMAENQLQDEHNKSYKRKGVELANEVKWLPNFVLKPTFGAIGFGIDMATGRRIRH
ncbi:P-loop containing nucleoside triphosphate hydrolase protein [Mycena maculata]|uniref:P-loop containing nucleoside triphosphate hydrolase protein n=1 Tax=Mycena maculata TaxID=230809 RepID=A0AAD7NYS4_9AGAR|nr:P-loop containing nucleoside triphosphate hydrolase protein [Mycena maculata]